MSWPPEGEPEFHGLCFLIMRRSGGLLLALPNGFPWGRCSSRSSCWRRRRSCWTSHRHVSSRCSLRRRRDAWFGYRVRCAGCGHGGACFRALVPFANVQVEEDIILGFSEDLGHLPDPARLLTFTKEWVSMNAAEQIAFYSAEDAPAPSGPPEPKQKAKAKATEKAKRPAALAAEAYCETCQDDAYGGRPAWCNPGGTEKDAGVHVWPEHGCAAPSYSDSGVHAVAELCKDDGVSAQDQADEPDGTSPKDACSSRRRRRGQRTCWRDDGQPPQSRRGQCSGSSSSSAVQGPDVLGGNIFNMEGTLFWSLRGLCLRCLREGRQTEKSCKRSLPIAAALSFSKSCRMPSRG